MNRQNFTEMQFTETIFDLLPDAICLVDFKSNTVKFVNQSFSNQLLSVELILGTEFPLQVLKKDDYEKYNTAKKLCLKSKDDVPLGVCDSLSTYGDKKCKL
jgi:hypothetical protein